jgi:hypothetical protein
MSLIDTKETFIHDPAERNKLHHGPAYETRATLFLT